MSAYSIFISYRRSDAAGHARGLYESLSERFGENRVFFDQSNIESGDAFPDALRQGIEDCTVLLALIGQEWLGFRGTVSRLEDPHDFVRQEIALALGLGKKVIPILFDEALFPPVDRLPVPLKSLASCDALRMRGKSYEFYAQRRELFRLLDDVLDECLDFSDDQGGDYRKLNESQKDIYRTLDLLRIRSLSDYDALAEHERHQINQELLGNMIDLRAPPRELLRLEHVNTRFPPNMVRDKPWDILHRKAAIYSDHALLPMDPIRIAQDSDVFVDVDHSINDTTIRLLLQHRSLIELGKMSIVPESVRMHQDNSSDNVIFNVNDLEAVKVDLKDPQTRSYFYEEGKLLKREATIVINSPNSAGLPLERIMEIISAKYPKEYGDFQRHLKLLMGSLEPSNHTFTLRQALMAVDQGICELDAKYESSKRRAPEEIAKAIGAGALAIALYTTPGSEVMSFIAGAFAGCAATSLVSLIPSTDDIPPEIRHSPFFVPWVIHHESVAA